MIDSRNCGTMVKAELYNVFVDKCLCMNCSKNKKIVRKNGTIKKVISCSSFRNKPKSYISRCQDWEKLEISISIK